MVASAVQVAKILYASTARCRKKDCPLQGDVVLETPLRRYESSCHSKTQKNTHQNIQNTCTQFPPPHPPRILASFFGGSPRPAEEYFRSTPIV